jgi:hypothetical protein
MTDTSEFLLRVESEVLRTRAVTKPTCEEFADLPSESRAAYAKSLRFLGCESANAPSEGVSPIREADRIRAVKLMLLSLYLDTSAPAWSSWMLDRLLEAVMCTPYTSC